MRKQNAKAKRAQKMRNVVFFMPRTDLDKIKQMAAKRRMTYKNLIVSVLEGIASGRLVEKRKKARTKLRRVG